MAEAALFSLAGKLLATIASPTLKKAYEKADSIWGAKDELHKLETTFQTIRAVLLDAEKKQEGSHAIRLWIKRVRDVLYEADDLFDEVTTDNQLKQQMKGNRLSRKVRVFGSHLNPIISSDSIAKRVKAIRKSLVQISEDMAPFSLLQCHNEEPIYGARRGQNEGHFVDPKVMFGREDDKKAILEFLFDESNAEQNISVGAIVGIGGMGKTTLAQLVYSDDKVKKKFERQRWWACISDIKDEKEVLGRIFKAMTGESHLDLTLSQIQSRIAESVISNEVFLLVLDDLWDSNYGMWLDRMGLLNSCAKGSKIIATTRSLSVAKDLHAVKTHQLQGLSPEKSWELFKRFAFTREQESDLRWRSLGEEIVKKCGGVPLAIRSIASLLRTKTTIGEWVSYKNNELSKIELSDNPIMSTLKSSYDHLSSNMKHCFAYCSLFPKGDYIYKRDIIYLWIAQGYVNTNNKEESVEEVGHAYFMELLRMSFFQETYEDGALDETLYCKMHDLVHDLAQLVSGDECFILSGDSDQGSKIVRHVSVKGICFEMDDLWRTSPLLHNDNRLRSFLLMGGSSLSPRAFDRQLTRFKFLRTLSLQNLNIQKVPSSIGELKQLKYLNLSQNKFTSLPETIGKLLNLIHLDVCFCTELGALPDDFRKLMSLRHLDTEGCVLLRCMPAGFEELFCLQRLSCFKVGKALHGGESSRLGALAGLKLKGDLKIQYDNITDDWDEDELMEEMSLLPTSLQALEIMYYPGMKILSLVPNLVSLGLSFCYTVKILPSFRCFPYLKKLSLSYLSELEYIEDSEGNGKGTTAAAGCALFFPSLEVLSLSELPKLKGWSREVEIQTAVDKELDYHHYHMQVFPRPLDLYIWGCPELRAMPPSPWLQTLNLSSVCMELIQTMLSKSLTTVSISDCEGLMSLHVEALTSVRALTVSTCITLKDVRLAPPHLNVLEVLVISNCPELAMWEKGKTGIDWDSLPKLHTLMISEMPELESLEGETLTSLISLSINDCKSIKKVKLPPADLNAIEELKIWQCPELELWEENKCGVDWDSLPNLRQLSTSDRIPNAVKLPTRLQQLQDLGKLKIIHSPYFITEY